MAAIFRLMRDRVAAAIAPCQCRIWHDTGAVFIWRNVDASQCPKRDHCDTHDVVGSA